MQQDEHANCQNGETCALELNQRINSFHSPEQLLHELQTDIQHEGYEPTKEPKNHQEELDIVLDCVNCQRLELTLGSLTCLSGAGKVLLLEVGALHPRCWIVIEESEPQSREQECTEHEQCHLEVDHHQDESRRDTVPRCSHLFLLIALEPPG